MRSHITLPPLRPSGESFRAVDVASTSPSHPRNSTANYTYKPQLKTCTSRNCPSPLSAAGKASKHHAAPAASAAASDDAGGLHDPVAPSHNVKGSTQVNKTNSVGTPHRTAAVFQAKLQRALFLDQLASCVHAERSARAALRCTEAEAREALWWPYQEGFATLSLQANHTQCCAVLAEAEVSQQNQTWRTTLMFLVEQEEPEVRRTIELDAANTFQLLCIAEGTEHVQLVAWHAAAEWRHAQALANTAREVRTLDLDLAAQSYRPIPAFNPSVDDLELTAEGRAAFGVQREAPLETWRRRFQREASLPDTAARTTLAVDQNTVKAAELCERQHIGCGEKKERLFLEWWRGAGDIAHVEAQERLQLWHLQFFAVSPLRMQAVVALQRWWRLLRSTPWKQLCRKGLRASLAALPHRHSYRWCKHQLHTLENAGALQSDSDHERTGGHRRFNGTGTDRSSALITAATHPRRYAMQLEWYTYTLLKKARMFCAGVGASPAIPLEVPGTEKGGMFEAALPCDSKVSSGIPQTRMNPFDASRKTRWTASSTGQSRASNHAAAAAASNKVPDGNTALGRKVHEEDSVMNTAMQALEDKAAAARQRISLQEEHERRVCASLFVLSNASPHSSSVYGVAQPLGNEPRSPEVNVPLSSTRETTEQDRRALEEGREGAELQSCVPEREGTSPEAAAALARAQQHVQQAVDALDTLLKQQQQQRQKSRNPTVTQQTGGRVLTQATTHHAVDKSVQHYSGAFDRAVSCVCAQQYTDVLKRFSALNVALLSAMQGITRDVLTGKGDIVSEESDERQRLVVAQESSPCVQLFQCMKCEEAERQLLSAARSREVDILYDSFAERVRLFYFT
jgi:hypothetical protein